MKNFDLGRKGLLSVLALLIGVGAEKFGGGLSNEMLTLLISVVSVFTGANVLSQKIGDGGKSSSPSSPEKVDYEPLAVDISAPSEDLSAKIAEVLKYVTDLDNVCGRQFTEYNKQHDETIKLLAAHGNSINGLTALINKGASRGPEQIKQTIVNLAE